MYGNIVAIHNVLKKNYIAKLSISTLFKKISKDNFEKKIKKTKEKEEEEEEEVVNFRKKKRRKQTCKTIIIKKKTNMRGK